MPLTHVPALRMVLRSMLADATFDVPEREWIERLFGMAAWSESAVHALTVVALRWVSTQRDDVRAAMRKALGEELNAQEEAMLPSQARLSSIHDALTTSLEGDGAMTIAELTEQHNGTIIVP